MKQLTFDPTQSAILQQRFLTTDGTLTTVTVSWNNRVQQWFADFAFTQEVTQLTSAGTVLVAVPQNLYGIKVVPGWPLLREYRSTFPLPGDFLFLPVSAAARNAPIQYNDLGTNWWLYWLTDAEIQAWEAYRGLD